MSKPFASELLQSRSSHPLDCCPAFQLYREVVTQPNGYALDEALFAVGLASDPLLDASVGMEQLDRMGSSFRSRLHPGMTAREIGFMLCEIISVKEGFERRRKNPNDETCFHLHELLKQRSGSPLLLAILYVEVARRARLQAGVIESTEGYRVLLKHGGESCVLLPQHGRLLEEAVQPEGSSQPVSAPALSNSELLLRVMRNLKCVYISNREMGRTLGMIQRILLVSPGDAREIRDRGIVFAQLECYQSARRDLQQYLQACPDEQDAELVRKHIRELSESGYTLH